MTVLPALHALRGAGGRVMMWAMDEQFYQNEVVEKQYSAEAPWWFSRLRGIRRIGAPADEIPEVFRKVDAEVKASCLG